MRVFFVGLLSVTLYGAASTASAQETRSARLYFGPSTLTASDGSNGGGVTLGYESAAGGKKVAGMWGIEFLGIDIANSDAFFPVFTVNGGLHITPWPQAKVIPYLNAELGASFVFFFLPAPTALLALGMQIPVGTELKLDVALQNRVAANPFDGQQINVATFALGVGF